MTKKNKRIKGKGSKTVSSAPLAEITIQQTEEESTKPNLKEEAAKELNEDDDKPNENSENVHSVSTGKNLTDDEIVGIGLKHYRKSLKAEASKNNDDNTGSTTSSRQSDERKEYSRRRTERSVVANGPPVVISKPSSSFNGEARKSRVNKGTQPVIINLTANTSKADVTYDANDPMLPDDIRNVMVPHVTNAQTFLEKHPPAGGPNSGNEVMNQMAMNSFKNQLDNLKEGGAYEQIFEDDTVKVAGLCPSQSGINNGKKATKEFKEIVSKHQIEKILEAVKTTVDRKPYCFGRECKKRATVACPACNKVRFCTAKHQKLFMKEHESECIPVRFSEKSDIGKYAIAARDLPETGEVVFSDKALVTLPLNPNLHYDGNYICGDARKFPTSYCVQCFTNFEASASDRIGICPCGCQLPVCKVPCNPSPQSSAHIHSECECKSLSSAYKKGISRKNLVIVDHGVVSLIRCLSVPLSASSDKYIRQKLAQMNRFIKAPEKTKLFESKMELLRKHIGMDCGIGVEEVFKIDLAIQRFGRNFGPGLLTACDETVPVSIPARYMKCVFQDVSYFQHSCLPNCVLVYKPEFEVLVRTQRDLKKGEMLTVSYDDKCLLYPTWKRRQHLLQEFGFSCKCKRCTSQSELDTYFSAFPCSQVSCNDKRKKAGYIVSENPLDKRSDWVCHGCSSKKKINHMRVEHLVMILDKELTQQKDALGLWQKIVSLVEDKYLHWNHFLVFNACLNFFRIMWEQLCKGNLKLMNAYSCERGLQFLRGADTVLNLVKKFIPFGYPIDLVLPMRIASVIKMRELTDGILAESISVDKVDDVIKDLYGRLVCNTNAVPLYRIPLARGRNNSSWEENLNIIELKALTELLDSLIPMYGNALERLEGEFPCLMSMYKCKVTKDPFTCGSIRRNEQSCYCFPWAMSV